MSERSAFGFVAAAALLMLAAPPVTANPPPADERQAQLPMVGELGTTSAANNVAAPAETPPPESIMDYLDTAPQPPATQDPGKPAVNQAAAPILQVTSQGTTP